MPLIISPKTTESVKAVFTEKLDLKKVPRKESGFWHGNFADSYYSGLDGKVNVIFTGYSGAVTGQALIEYASRNLANDPRPEVYFIGSVFAFKHSSLELGDIVFAKDTYSPDSFEQCIYKNAQARGIDNITWPDSKLLGKTIAAATIQGIPFKTSKVYCRITPGHMPNFTSPTQLMGDAMWWPIALNPNFEQGCDSGEYESAAVLATSKLFGIPAVALLDVKDKRYSETDYRVAKSEQMISALHSMLGIVRDSILK